MQAQELIRRTTPVLNWILLATLIGAVFGVCAALLTALENSYFESSMRNLAGRVLEIGTLRGARWGLMFAAGSLLVFVAALSVFRLIGRSSRTATWSAVSAVPVFALLAVVAFKINVEVLPAFLSARSLLVNAALLVVSCVLWWMSVRWLLHQQDRLAIVAGSRTMTGVLFVLLVLSFGVPLGLAQLWKIEVESEKPNVLIVLIDTLRADRLGSYGYHRETSPNIDRVASEGWRFTSAIAQAPWTKPSVASMITGLYPRQTSISSGDWETQGQQNAVLVQTLAAEHLTLAEKLAAHGYETAAFGKNHHLLAELGFAQGYLTYDWLYAVRLGGLTRILNRFRPELAADSTVQWIDDRFVDWLDANKGRKYFAYLHQIDVHWPYVSPASFEGTFLTSPPPENFNATKFLPDAVKRLKDDSHATLNPDTVRATSDAYDECIRYVDDGLGKVIEALKQRGLYDNTLIIITADHGEVFMEHGVIGHGESLYDELIHVPLIVKFPCPGPRCGPRTVTTQVELADIFPTVMETVSVGT